MRSASRYSLACHGDVKTFFYVGSICAHLHPKTGKIRKVTSCGGTVLKVKRLRNDLLVQFVGNFLQLAAIFFLPFMENSA